MTRADLAQHADVRALDDQYEAIERDARALVASIDERMGTWRSAPGSWSIAECLDHLAVGTRVYLRAMAEPVRQGRAAHRVRRRPLRPGLLGGLFAWSLEPPVNPRLKQRAPAVIVPRASPPLADAAAAFFTAHEQARAFLRANADLDLAGLRFPNPFVRGIRFSVASGLHIIASHDRRHLWQARRVLEAARQAGVG